MGARAAVATLDHRPARSAGSPARERDRILERVALALNSTLELREVLRLLAEITLDVSAAERCSLFLLDGRVLRPAVAISRSPDRGLWSAFRVMDAVDLSTIPTGWERLTRGRAIAVSDARANPLVPESWTDRFSLRSLVLVPLLAQGEPCGLLVLDDTGGRRFTAAELRLLEAIGGYAGVAVRNAGLFETTRRQLRMQEALANGAAALASAAEAAEVAERLVDAYAELLGASLCAIGLFDPDQQTIATVAARGTRDIRGPLTLADVPERIVARLGEAWEGDTAPVELEDDPWLADFVGGAAAGATGYLAIPLVVQGRAGGAVLLGFEDLATVTAEEREGAGALAAMAAAALERRTLQERLARQVTGEDDAVERAIRLDRERMANDLHDTTGQVLVGIGLLAHAHVAEAPAGSPWTERMERLADLAERGKSDLDQAVRGLAFVPAVRRGLVPSLRAMIRVFECDSGIPVILEVKGRPARLPAEVERALYRVAHQAVANAWRHARCANVRAELSFDDREVVLRVRDDGVGLGRRWPDAGPGTGIGSMRRAIEGVGGHFRIHAGTPRGVLVEARAPRTAA